MLDKPAVIKKPFISKEVSEQIAVLAYNYFGVIIFLAVTAIMATAWLVVIEPKFTAINSGEEFLRKTEEYKSQVLYYGKISAIKAAYAKIKDADKNKIDSFVNVSGDASGLFREIDYLVRLYNMKPDNIEPRALEDNFEIVNPSGSSKRNTMMSKTKVWRTTVTLISDPETGAEVTYGNLKKLLAAMEVNLRLMDVQRVAFDPIKKTAIIELLTYARK